METSGLRIGVSVDIQRSDGRVHSAVVSSVDHDRKCVTVEWFERGETKGKEIDYDQIFKLNPDLQTPPANSAPAKPVTAPQVEETRERRSQAANTPKETKDPNEKHQQSFAVQPSRLPSSRPSMLPGASKSGIPTPSLNNIARPASSHGQPPVNGSNANGDHTPVANGNIEEGHLQAAALNAAAAVNSAANSHFAIPQAPAPRAAAATAATAAAAADETPAEERAAPVVAPRAAGGAKAERIREREREREQRERERELREAEAKDAKNKRQSTTLAAIQRIAEKREERRAHARNKHDCPEYDPSNPNWEFIRMIREFVDTLNYNPLTLNDSVEQRQITVCVRKRPINKKELAARAIDVVTVPAKDIIYVHEPKSKVDLTKYLDNQTFRFDYAFNEDADNELVYKFTAQPLVESIFERGMATCFAYGQTGSGKTHTMGGNFESGTRGQQDSSRGVYLMAARDVFKLLNSRYKKEGLIVGATFFEIYSGKVFDLLNNKHRLKILEDGKAVVQVVGLKEEPVASVEEVYKLIQAGNACRTSGQTSANNYSSRSHAVFQIVLRKAATRKLHGKFSLIDLAGNERGADTMSSDRSTRMESAEINKSLLALKECIRALGRRGAHLPFRASKLTLVLRDSFVGENSRTCMIAMISPGNNCVEHTLNTLRYADRVKELDSSSGGDAGAGGQQPSDAPPPRRYSDEHVDLMAENAADSEGEDDEILSLNSSVSSSHDDLGLIKTANQGEVPDEMFNLQDVVEHINELEEGIVEDYRDLLDDMPEWTNAQHDILKMADDVECDAELLASRLEQQVDAQLKRFQAMKEKLERFKQTLRQEEILSKNLSQKRTEPAPPPASQAHAPAANKPTARR